jgi:hypothetical protein
MALTLDGVRHIECKDDSNRLLFVRILEIQLTSGSKLKRNVHNGKKIRAATESIPSELSGPTCLYLNY